MQSLNNYICTFSIYNLEGVQKRKSQIIDQSTFVLVPIDNKFIPGPYKENLMKHMEFNSSDSADQSSCMNEYFTNNLETQNKLEETDNHRRRSVATDCDELIVIKKKEQFVGTSAKKKRKCGCWSSRKSKKLKQENQDAVNHQNSSSLSMSKNPQSDGRKTDSVCNLLTTKFRTICKLFDSDQTISDLTSTYEDSNDENTGARSGYSSITTFTIWQNDKARNDSEAKPNCDKY